mgnify:CR=1 FL=1
MTYKLRQLTLRKGEETYLFRYRPGEESGVVDDMARWAANPELNFDWFDAAVLCYQMGRRIENEMPDKVEER